MYSDCSMSFKSLSEREVDQHKFKTKLCVKERSYTVGEIETPAPYTKGPPHSVSD